MKWRGTRTNNWGLLLLAIWLIVSGMLTFIPITFIQTGPILAVLAIVAGILILLGR
jgi:hypothetical protein